MIERTTTVTLNSFGDVIKAQITSEGVVSLSFVDDCGDEVNIVGELNISEFKEWAEAVITDAER